MPRIQYRDINLGGIAASKYQGPSNSLATIVGLDIHSEPGIVKVNQKLKDDDVGTVDDLVLASVNVSAQDSYWFGSTNGKIWKRTNAGTWSLAATAAPAAGGAGILDAKEFNGFVYYAMESRLGRWLISSGIGSRDDDFATFSQTDANFHPMKIINNRLYIGDASQVALVDNSDSFTANALDIPTRYRISSLGQSINDLLIGTYISDQVSESEIFQWDTYSISWSTSDIIKEVGIYSFLEADNIILVQAGYKGNIYQYDGQRLIPLKKIPGDWDDTNKAKVYHNASAVFRNVTLFGLTNVSGDPALQGVYSFGSHSAEFPRVLSIEYLISTGLSASVEIGVIDVVGDSLMVSWKKDSTFGVDIIDWANKFNGAFFETRIIFPEREMLKNFLFEVFYRTLPSGTDIILTKSENYEALAAQVTVDDVRRFKKYAEVSTADVVALQMRLATSASSNNAPEIEFMQLSY